MCKPSADPMKYIADRGMMATKVTAILMAVGVLASGIYGMVEAGPHLVNQTVGTIGTLTVSSHTDSLQLIPSWTLHRLCIYYGMQAAQIML